MAERRPHPATCRPLRATGAAGSSGTSATRSSRPAGGQPRTSRQSTTRSHRSHEAAGRTLRGSGVGRPRPGRTGTRPKPKKTLRVPLANGARRLHVVLIMLAVALSLCAGRLLQLQGFDSSAYAAESAAALTQKLPLLPSRGDITDRNGTVLAATEPAVAVTADPSLTGNRPYEFASVIAPHLDMTVGQLIPLLTKPNTHFVYLKKKVPAMTYTRMAAALSERNLYGVFRESDPIRTYPAGPLVGPIVGFVGGDGKGQEGLELKLNTQLAGVEGQEVYESAPNGSKIPLGNSKITPAQNGYDYQLTLDSELQWVAQRRVAQQVTKAKADFGFAITMNIKTGEILALAQAPGYDSNQPAKMKDIKFGSLQAINAPYEPGSVQKVLTAAALIDSGVADENTRLEVPNRLTSGPYQIKDHFEHKDLKLTMRGVIARSSNIGTVMLSRQMPTEQLHDYLVKFGLGAQTGIELPGEAIGILPGAQMQALTRDRVAFGQGLTVTGIQEISAIAGLVNDGVYHPPTILKSATDTDGKQVQLPVKESRRVVSSETSSHIRDLMRAVVDNSGQTAALRLDGYTSGGKTGTAQRGTSKGYKGYITSYVGYAPLNDPQIMTYVVINNPRKGDSGTQVAAPVYHDIMQYALPRYSVEPTKKSVLKPKEIEW